MPRVDAATLEAFAGDVLRGMGASDHVAERVAASLVDADRVGHTSHGVLRLPWYAEMVDAGRIDPTATPAVAEGEGATAAIDGRHAFGQVVAREAVAELVTRTREHGVAAVGFRDATHVGRLGEWAERTTAEGFAFAAFLNTQGGSLTVTPPGAAERTLAANPVAFGLPTRDVLDFDVVLDMATSQVAHGKIRERAHTGEALPEAWTTFADGDPVRDAQAFEDGAGALLPLGGRASGYKGFGLTVVAELFAALVGDALVAGQGDDYCDNAGAFLAVDPRRFSGEDAAEERIAALAAHLQAVDPSPDVPVGHGAKGDEPLLPGEAEHRARQQAATEDEIDVPERVVDSVRDLAAERGVDVPAALR